MTGLTLLPNTTELQDNPDEQHDRRVFFIGIYCYMIAAVLFFLTLRWLWFEFGTTGWEPLGTEPDEVGEEPQETGRGDRQEPRGGEHEVVEGFTSADLRFLMCDMAYHYGLASLVFYAHFKDFLSKDTGLDWELYAPWLFEALLTPLVCAFLSNRNFGKRRVWPMMLLADLVGERFQTLRDWVTLGVLLQVGTPVAGISFIMTLASLLAARWVVYGNRAEVKQMRLHFWPIAIVPSDEQVYYSLQAFLEATSIDTSLLPDDMQEDWGFVRNTMIDLCFSSTCAFKQKFALIEQVPQALSGLFFATMSQVQSAFVLFSTATTITQAVAIVILRPHVVCLKARLGKPWQHLSARDIEWARKCRSWRGLPCSLAAAEVLASPDHAPADVRLAAADALGRESARARGQESADSRSLSSASRDSWVSVSSSAASSRVVSRASTRSWSSTGPSRGELGECLRPLVAYVLARLAQQLREAEFRCLAQHVGDWIEDVGPDLAKGAANLKRWDMVVAILQHSQRANVNYCEMTAEALDDMAQKFDEPLALTYLNLNDNKKLCCTEVGLRAVVELLRKAPNLKQLKVANTGLTEAGKAELERAWGSRPQEGLVLHFAPKVAK